MKPLAVQICGTGSGVGKSVLVSALCRIFLQDGYKVCPFKAQNMSLNSFVTQEGGEIARAQVVQAYACRIEPDVDMNPVLIKPTADMKAQIIIQGKATSLMTVKEYIRYKKTALKNIKESLNRLKERYEIIVIEGAGSPAEINLKSHDIVNMKIAEISGAPVIIAGDIDKGGVFASFVGTMELLDTEERKRIKGFIINKFRGDKSLLKSGIDFLERKTKKPVLGVIPYFKDIKIPEEDSVNSENTAQKRGSMNEGRRRNDERRRKINIAVINLPYISNFTDFDALENEPDVNLRYINDKNGLNDADIIIIPGTRNTIADLLWLKETGLAEKILSAISAKNIGGSAMSYGGRYTPSAILIGICGGYQMLGRVICDRLGVESSTKEIKGLGLLPIATSFEPEKTLSQIKAKEAASGIEIQGYEIHHGKTISSERLTPLFEIGNNKAEGAISECGRIWGTYLHGIFDNNVFRREFLNRIRIKKGLQALPKDTSTFNLDTELNKLAGLVRQNIDMKLLYKILTS